MRRIAPAALTALSVTDPGASARNVVVPLSAGREHGLIVKPDRTLTGIGTGAATPPTAATNIAAVASGDNFNLALTAAGTVLVWGYGHTMSWRRDSGVIFTCASLPSRTWPSTIV